MKIDTKVPAASASSTGADEISPEGQAEIARLRAEREMLAGSMKLEEEDPFAKIERLHRNSMATLPVIGAKSPTANVGKGPQPGDPGVGKAQDFIPMPIKG
jgi:hypothetical protein